MILNAIIYIFAIFGLAFLIKESDGPWGIMAWLRNKLMTNKHVGVFFYKLFACYFCVGFWAGIVIYLLSQETWKFNLLICWGLSGGVICLLIDALLSKLHQ